MNKSRLYCATTGLSALIAVGVVSVVPRDTLGSGHCTVGLDALATCQQDSTGSCPTANCNATGSDGTEFSGNVVHTTNNTGNSLSDGTEEIQCSRPANCDDALHPDKECKTIIWPSAFCRDQVGEECTDWTQTFGSWVNSPSAKIKACDES